MSFSRVRGHDQRLPAGEHVLPGGAGRRRSAGRFRPRGRRLVGRPLLAVAGGVEQGLARVGDGAHQRARVLARRAWPCGGAAPPAGAAPSPPRLSPPRLRRTLRPGSTPSRRDDERGGDRRRRAPSARRRARTRSRASAWGASGPPAGGGGPAPAPPGAARGAGRPRPPKPSMRPGVTVSPLTSMTRASGGNGEARAHGLDEPVAHHDRAVLEDGAGDGDHAAADERVDLAARRPWRGRQEQRETSVARIGRARMCQAPLALGASGSRAGPGSRTGGDARARRRGRRPRRRGRRRPPSGGRRRLAVGIAEHERPHVTSAWRGGRGKGRARQLEPARGGDAGGLTAPRRRVVRPVSAPDRAPSEAAAPRCRRRRGPAAPSSTRTPPA